MTKLDRFITENDLSPTAVFRAASCSERYLQLLRKGESDPTIGKANDIRLALEELTGKNLRIEDIFDLPQRRSA